jgi:hypothetical protein
MGFCLPKNKNLPQGLARRKMGMPLHWFKHMKIKKLTRKKIPNGNLFTFDVKRYNFSKRVKSRSNKPKRLLYKRMVNKFLTIFTFSYEGPFDWNFLQVFIKNTYSQA